MKIRDWPSNERPREKLLNYGSAALSEAELLAIILRTGVKGCSALELARMLLNKFGSLSKVTSADLESFCDFDGLGSAKYIQLQAAVELSRRMLYEVISSQSLLDNPTQTKQYLLTKLSNKEREIFACIFLNSQHEAIAYQELFQGSIHQAEIYPREVIKQALKYNAAALIIAHNHPSGTLQPSNADKDITRQLRKTLALVDIRLLDHIIVAGNKTFSFVEQGLMD